MPEQTYKHKLTAIFYADVAGYSRLTGRDETGTHRRVMAALDLVSDRIKTGGGIVLRYAGDAILAEFPSVVAALNTATGVQTSLSVPDPDTANADRIQIRIGVNLGEVLQDRGEIYGDGVNLAARLEAAAQPGGVCISSAVYDQVAGKVDVAFTDGGFESFKNIARPVHVFHWTPGRSDSPRDQPKKKDNLPTIAIEGFACLPNDEENQVFAAELGDQLSLRVSHRTGVRVLDTPGQGESGAAMPNYLLRGGTSNRLSSRCKANLSMIWCATGETLWAESFSGSLGDPFAFIEEITDTVDAAIRIQINAFDARRLNDREEAGLDASELFDEGRRVVLPGQPGGLAPCHLLVDRALAVRPEHAMTLAMRVEGGAWLAAVMPEELHDEDDERLSKMADRAIELNGQSDFAFFARGLLRLFRLKDFQRRDSRRKKSHRAVAILRAGLRGSGHGDVVFGPSRRRDRSAGSGGRPEQQGSISRPTGKGCWRCVDSSPKTSTTPWRISIRRCSCIPAAGPFITSKAPSWRGGAIRLRRSGSRRRGNWRTCRICSRSKFRCRTATGACSMHRLHRNKDRDLTCGPSSFRVRMGFQTRHRVRT